MSNSNISLPADCGKLDVSISPTKQPASATLTLARISSPTRQHRVEQLRMEEGVDQRKREEHHEREVKELFRLNQSWEKDMKLESEEHTTAESMEVGPVHSFVAPSSPVLRMVRSRSLTPTSPSGGRTHYSCQRSLSPVNPLRPSCLSIKRRREAELEDMDMSPGQPIKRLAYGYSSPHSSSPCVSPLTTNGSPFNHTLSHTPRKLYSHAEQSPFVSPSSTGIANPFAFHYDANNCDSSSSNGSASHSPQLIITTSRKDSKHSAESLKDFNSSEVTVPRPTVDTLEAVFEVPTPLSPKNLQFRHRPLQNVLDVLPSPVPHQPRSVATLKSSCTQASNEHFYHDSHLSPFSSEATPQGSSSNRAKLLSLCSSPASTQKCYRQLNKPEPLRQFPGDCRGLCSSRISLHSPLSKRAIMDDFTDQRIYHGMKADYMMAGSQTIGLDSIPVDRRTSNFEEMYGARGDGCPQLHPM